VVFTSDVRVLISDKDPDVSEFDSLIIGGGHNGLVCAFYLARAGHKVVVLERRSLVGGAAVTEEFYPGFRNSTASYTVSLLNPSVIQDMGLKEWGLRFVKRPVANFLPLSDTSYLKVGGGLTQTQSQLRQFSIKDADTLPIYYQRLDAVADIVRTVSQQTPPKFSGGVVGLLRAAWDMRDLIRAPFEVKQDLYYLFTQSARQFLDRWFESDPIKAALGFDAVVGNYASPDTPGSAYVLLHHVFGELDGEKGAWGHAIGGMGAITQTMAQACTEIGVEIRTDAPVERVLIEAGIARGVILRDGTRIRAKRIASNVNPVMLYRDMIDPAALEPQFLRHIENYRCGSGTFRINVALSELPDFSCLPGREAAEHHQSGIIMAPSLEYMNQAYLEAQSNGFASKPIVEMLIPSVIDSSLAPSGQHVASLFCQHFAPIRPDGKSWHECQQEAVEAIINTVTSHAPNFKDAILGMMVLSPLDLEERFGLIGGDIFHGAMTLDQLWAARPVLDYGDYRGPIKGLYHCGAGAHPGGGVTGLPGKNAAREMLRDPAP